MSIDYLKSRYFEEHGHWHLEIHPGDKVLEVGPGQFPFPYATHWLDNVINPNVPADKLTVDSVTHMPFADKEFDAVLASHVLEHVEDVETAMAELQRVGKRGAIQCPHIAKDWFFQHGETHRLWQVLKTGNRIVFVRLDKPLLDEEWKPFPWSVMWQPDPANAVMMAMNAFLWRSSEFLNPSVYWDEKTAVEYTVIR